MANERDDDIAGTVGTAPQLASVVSHRVADLVGIATHLRDCVGIGCERELDALGQMIGDVYTDMANRIADLAWQPAQLATIIERDICSWIEGQLGAVEGTLSFCEAAIAKAKKRLDKLTGPAIVGASDAVPPIPSGELSQLAATLEGVEITSSAPSNGGTSIFGAADPFPSPPTAPELVGLAIPLAGGQGAIPLVSLPEAAWDKGSGEPTFVALLPTPLTRAVVQTVRVTDTGIQPEGMLTINSIVPMPLETIQCIVEALGAEPAAVTTYTAQEAWDNASAIWGEPLVRITWNTFGIPPPPIQQAPGHVPPLEQARLPAPEPITAPFAPKSLQESPTAAPHAQAGDRPCPPQPCPTIEFTGLPGLPGVESLISQIPIPSLAQICALLARPVGWVGLDAARMPPCASFEEMKRYLRQRAHED